MKNFLKALSLISLGALLTLTLLATPFSREALAQISAQFIKPLPIAQQGNQDYNTLPESTEELEYAIPTDVNLYNIVGSKHQNLNIHDALYLNYIKTSPLIQDINGDGLNDMVYSYSFNGHSAYEGAINVSNQYIMLNNGRGYDLVYKCNRNGNQYTGDCAKTP